MIYVAKLSIFFEIISLMGPSFLANFIKRIFLKREEKNMQNKCEKRKSNFEIFFLLNKFCQISSKKWTFLTGERMASSLNLNLREIPGEIQIFANRKLARLKVRSRVLRFAWAPFAPPIGRARFVWR